MLEDFKLKTFVTVCKTRSFTVAARMLGVTQPAVSQNVSELEKSLGVTLFDRARGNISLTPDGEEFKKYADRILYWYDAVDRRFVSKRPRPDSSTAVLDAGDGEQLEVRYDGGELSVRLIRPDKSL